MAGQKIPFPTDPAVFPDDPRVYFDRVTQSHKLEDEEGAEWEWFVKPGEWVPVLDEEAEKEQQSIYKVAGVNEDAPALDPKKRKAAALAEQGNAKKQKSAQPPPPQKNTAVYITSLPDDVTEEELHTTFSRFGVIAESAEFDKPRIKLYCDDNGKFKGDALIVYFRPESVPLAITMLDETDFRYGQKVASGPMRVREADRSYKAQKDKPQVTEEARKKGTDANRNRQKLIKKNAEMNSRLADWDDDDPSTLPDTSSRWDKVVVLKHMFTLEALEKDPAEYLNIKEDVREEAEKYGTVTNVVLWDKEEEGVMTVRFSVAVAAAACARNFNGRNFDERPVVAYIADGSEKFRKFGRDDESEEAEAARLERYGNFIEGKSAS